MNLSPVGPSWRNIVPGQTTQQEVTAIMGPPAGTPRCDVWLDAGMIRDLMDCFSASPTFEYREVKMPDKAPAIHKIRFKGDKVWVVIEDLFLRPEAEGETIIKEAVEKYGWPERITYARKVPYLRGILFCEHGYMLMANSFSADRSFYFVPMTTEQCLQVFRREVSVDDVWGSPADPQGDLNEWPWLQTRR